MIDRPRAIYAALRTNQIREVWVVFPNYPRRTTIRFAETRPDQIRRVSETTPAEFRRASQNYSLTRFGKTSAIALPKLPFLTFDQWVKPSFLLGVLYPHPTDGGAPHGECASHQDGIPRSNERDPTERPCDRRPTTARRDAADTLTIDDHQQRRPLMASTTQTLPATTTAPAAIPISTSPPGAILALDLGTITGWALLGSDGVVTSGTASFKPSRYDGGGMRYLRFRFWLEQLRRYAGHIEAVHFEEVRRHVGVDAAHLYGGFLATLSAWCEHQTIPYQGVPVGTIKRFIAGKGNAGKDEVIAAVKARGFAPSDDNEADALAILLWAIKTKGGVQ